MSEPEPRDGRLPEEAVPPSSAGPEPEIRALLPEPVRQRVVALAAAALPGLPFDELPVPLRRVAKFAPNRRARLGGAADRRPARRRLAVPPADLAPG